MSQSDIYRAAQQIAEEGKQPSVALIKNKLASPLPLQMIIKCLQQWKTDPDACVSMIVPLPSIKGKLSAKPSLEKLIERIESLEARVRQLENNS